MEEIVIVRILNCDQSTYNKIANEIYEKIYFGIINDKYSLHLRTAWFTFRNEECIPLQLRPYIVEKYVSGEFKFNFDNIKLPPL